MNESVPPVEKSASVKQNHLAHEKSPYLLQHATNPVDWYPWGEEAFAKARSENKPVFLSIGYSTCHWCHVMERESFSDPAVAAVMNQHFVSIKVDREERPDVDNLYMKAVMQMTGHGGWPLNIFLTPDLKPFYGGTYFPPEDQWGQPGLKKILLGVGQAWGERREEVLRTSEGITQALQIQASASPGGAAPVGEELIQQAYRDMAAHYDPVYGGFSPAPKFPRSHTLQLILRYWKRGRDPGGLPAACLPDRQGQAGGSGAATEGSPRGTSDSPPRRGSGRGRSRDPQALKIVEYTLQAMVAGGLYDQLGGGFHRYSTDEQWRIPHFEKMLYDQALLSAAYLEAAQATGRSAYAATAREIFEYLLRDMTDPEGAFTSAEDADSAVDPSHPEEKEEGAFYLWKQEEITQLLGPEQGKIFSYLFGIESTGNALHDPTGEFKGKNVLYRAHTLEEAAKKFQRPVKEIETLVTEAKQILLEARRRRPRPHRDDKVLVDWNGLMISSLAFGSQVLGEPRYAHAAEKAAAFILKHLVRQDGRLLHRYRDGEAALLGTLEDYAFFIHGLIDLYEATFEPSYLNHAKGLTSEMIRLFWDKEHGGFFLTGEDAQPLLVRQKEIYDGAIPSGNSIAALDLLRVGRLTMERSFEEKARALMETFSAEIHQMPSAFPQMLMALHFALGPSSEVVIAGAPGDRGTQQMIDAIYQVFLPNKVVVFHPSGNEAAQLVEKEVPFVKEQVAVNGKPTVYLCQNYTCQRPATNLDQLQELLKGSSS